MLQLRFFLFVIEQKKGLRYLYTQKIQYTKHNYKYYNNYYSFNRYDLKLNIKERKNQWQKL